MHTSPDSSNQVANLKVASRVKVLNLAGSKSLIKTPNFSKFIRLERLVLKEFLRLAEIDYLICKLKGLIYLKIKWWPYLRGLPKEISYLIALKELLSIHGFRVHYLPDSISNLRHSSRLVMEDLRLVKLLDTIKRLMAL